MFLPIIRQHKLTTTASHPRKPKYWSLRTRKTEITGKEPVMAYFLALCQSAFERTKEKHKKMKSVKTDSP